MLFTRCPHCSTTFRITAEALNKANGQVRCGRCVNIFNAHAELREASDESPEPANALDERSPEHTSGATKAQRDASSTVSDANPAGSSSPGHCALPAPEPFEGKEIDAEELRAQTEAQAEAEATAAHVDTPSEEPATSSSTWLPEEAEAVAGRPRLWTAAAILALLALLGQITHHFRDQFAKQPLIGPVVQGAYAFLGAPVTPRWDIEQYRILDWVATAEPSSNDRGDLAIRARIQNRGPAPQPFPHVLVQLKDRWESTIGSRVFAPHEYLANIPRADALMPPGDTANAALTLVDPGPDAYGFELDVCVEYSAAQLRCATDRVFR